MPSRAYYSLCNLLAPGLRNSQYAYASALRERVGQATAWLDVGCGHEHLPSWMPVSEAPQFSPSCTRVGVDPDRASLICHPTLRFRVQAFGEALPFRDMQFDLVTANMVVEHVERPVEFFRELRRVLTPGGQVLLHTPNARGYTTLLTRLVPPVLRPRLASVIQRRREEDVYPTWYRANTASAVADLAREVGFDTARVDLVETSPMFVEFAPIAVFELMLVRALRASALAAFRPCLVVSLRRPESL